MCARGRRASEAAPETARRDAAPALHLRAQQHTIFPLVRITAVQLRSILPAVATLMLAPGVANAATCYILFDRYDNVVYRNTVPPIDLSDQGSGARDALRQQGEYLMVMESEHCAPVTFVFGIAGSKNLSIDETVGGFPAESHAAAPGPSNLKVRRAPAAPAATPSDRTAPATPK
jgi:hypothetical protein